MNKALIFKVTGKPNAQDIIKYTDMQNIWFRFQNPKHDIKGEYTQSFGMIYDTVEEAIKNCESDNLTENEAILSGKSCMPSFHEIMTWSQYYSKDDVLLVFKGYDTRETGHDGEYVAEYEKTIAVYSINDVIEFYKNNMEDENGNFNYYEWRDIINDKHIAS